MQSSQKNGILSPEGLTGRDNIMRGRGRGEYFRICRKVTWVFKRSFGEDIHVR